MLLELEIQRLENAIAMNETLSPEGSCSSDFDSGSSESPVVTRIYSDRSKEPGAPIDSRIFLAGREARPDAPRGRRCTRGEARARE